MSKCFGETQHGSSDSPLRRQNASRDHAICVAQAVRKKDHQMFVKLRMFVGEAVKVLPTDKIQPGIPKCRYGRRSRRPIDFRQFTNDRAWAENSQNRELIVLVRIDLPKDPAVVRRSNFQVAVLALVAPVFATATELLIQIRALREW
jgi:hypothetical protein